MSFARPIGAATGRAIVGLACAALLAGCGGAEARRDRYFEKAQALIAEQDYEKAQLELRNALQIDPNDARSRVLLGNVAEKLGNPRQAAQMYMGVLEADKEDAGARAGLAKLYALSGLPEKALDLANAGLAKAPGDSQLLTARGAALAQKGDIAAALADAEKAVRNDRKNPDAVALLASLYARSNRTDEAIAVLKAGIGDSPKDAGLRIVQAKMLESSGQRKEAAQAYAGLIALDPNNLAYHSLLVQFHLNANEVDAAEAAVRAAIKANPDKLQMKLALASLLATRRSFEVGERELLALVASAPKDLELLVGLGDFYAQHGKQPQADAVYRQVIAKAGREPQGLVARNRLADSALRQRDTTTASKLLAEVLEVNSRDNVALALRAQIALERADGASAISDLRAILRDQPDSIPAQRALAQAYILNNDLGLAEQTLKTALAHAPSDPQLRVDEAQLMLQGGRTDQARLALEDAVAQTPTNLAAQQLLFKVQASKQDYVGARKTAQLVKSARPDLPLGDYLTGLVDRAEDKPDAAVESFDRALKLQPDAAEPLTAMVETLLTQKRNDVALARLAAVIEAQPKNAVPLNLRGEIFLSQKRSPDALADFGRAIAIAPTWWVPYRGQALAHLLEKNSRLAIDSYAAGIKATGAGPLSVDLAALHQRLGQPEDSIKVYEEFHRRSPDSDLAANNLAMLLVTYRQDPQSLARAREITARFASSTVPAYLNTAGWVQYKLGNYPAAIPLLQSAADKEPSSAQLRYMLGMAQYKAGKRNEALKSLESSVSAGKAFAGIEDARAAIADMKRS